MVLSEICSMFIFFAVVTISSQKESNNLYYTICKQIKLSLITLRECALCRVTYCQKTTKHIQIIVQE